MPARSLEEDFWFLPPKQLVQIAEARARREREERESAESERKFKEELARWEKIKDSRNPEDFYAFLRERPSGYIAEQAQFRLDQLEKPVVQAQPGANGINPVRFRVFQLKVANVHVVAQAVPVRGNSLR